jgi:hypothetical protein
LGRTDQQKEKLSEAFPEYGLKTDEHLKFLSRRSGANCSSGLLIVDRRVCMVGSSWWGEGSVGRSRAANLLIDSPRVADYYSQIFDTDWDADP